MGNTPRTDAPKRIDIALAGATSHATVQVVEARPYTLLVDACEPVPHGSEWSAAQLIVDGRTIALTGCRYYEHPQHPQRRHTDPPAPPGTGQLVFRAELHDFQSLLRRGSVSSLAHRMQQLPLLWGRRATISPAFRDFTAELVYDLQVYRSLLDDVDRNLAVESADVAEDIRRQVADAEYPRFCAIFDARLRGLEHLAQGFSNEENERHGFYFRRHVWDMILSSEFLARTNLKPRGYAGDSEMMRMVYEDSFRGPTIFSRFLHRHPLTTWAAQAVRNRIGLLAERMRARKAEVSGPLRIMSVACGPARELSYIFDGGQSPDGYRFTLLDQDEEALAEAKGEVRGIAERTGINPEARYIRESVRTMLRLPSLADAFGAHDFVYSMGLFDYLTPPVAKAVLSRMYELLAPGGEMVVGNYHVENKSRVYMEYWMDWVLYYRTEDEMLELGAELPGATSSVFFEDTRSQMFLSVRKPA